ncbi:MAG: hypothetical protein ACLPVF_00880 [Acidimicrobiales bacterium]
MGEQSTEPDAPPGGDLRLIKTQRVLQIVLGLFWLLDAGLQFQPYMFGRGFTSTYLLANAQGQPDVIRWIITNVGNFVGPHVAVWNTFFALIQVAIGGGLLFRRTVRPALFVSFFWAFGVWFFGEGLGMIFTGSATALTGAPGSVFMYGLIGLMAWPRKASPTTEVNEPGDRAVGLASSAAGQGIGGAVTPLAVWSGFWALAAVLFLLPVNRTETSVSSAISGMSAGEPGGYAHFLTHFGNHFGSVGVQTAWLLAIASLVVGLGPLLARRPNIFLFFGGLLATFFWITGQGFGGVFTGSGTDPNTGPLVILLALAMVPAALPERSAWRSPFAAFLRWNPVLAVGSAVMLGVALFLSAAYPVAALESTSMAMSGMAGMTAASMDSGSTTASSASCTTGNGGIARSGLDLTNTPYMMMGGNDVTGMDMNGADASAAAGLNTTKARWHYDGPALPAVLAQQLLTAGNNGPDYIHMAESGCASEPTYSDEINAIQYVQSTSQAAAQYPTPAAAEAAGYVAVSPTNYPVVYYVNPAIVASNAAAARTLDPHSIDGLVYATIPSGESVLVAAMYLLPSTVSTPPMPYGALVQWHQRTNVCGPLIGASTAFDVTGFTPCASGTIHKTTPYMTMVWQVPVAGGPLAIQPPDIQIVEAAVMSSGASG